jgi:hypothetical protein
MTAKDRIAPTENPGIAAGVCIRDWLSEIPDQQSTA